MTIAGDYIGRVRLGVTIGAAGSQSFVWPDGRPAGTYTADAGPDGTITLTVTEPDADTLTVAWAGADSRRMIGHPWRVLRDGAWLFGDLYVTEAEPSDQDPAEMSVIDGTVEVRVAMVAPSGGGGGVTDHGDLTGRNEVDQHSSDAISVPAGTMAFIGEFYPPATDSGTDHLNSVDLAIEAAAGGIVGAYAQLADKLDAAEKGAPDGVAELDGSGKVLSSQLPSYVDDVIEVANVAALPVSGEGGKIYVAIEEGTEWRWGGTTWSQISKSLALGTTSSTAYRGDHGAATAAGLLDLSGVDPAEQATARWNLGLGSLAVKSAVDRADVTTGAIDAALLDPTVAAQIAAAVPNTRTITAGTGLTGGGSLAADRSLAVAYGLTASTAVEGIALPHKTWRTGSYYGIDLPIANTGTAMASGAVRAMAFYNPVAGRAVDQIALDVFSASGSPAAYLYICTDDGTGYPGTVVASNSITPAATSRLTASVTYTLPRGLLWFVAHSTAVTWAGLNFSNLAQSPYLPTAASYSANGMSCWSATGAGTSALTAFPAGASPAASGLQISVRAA